MGEFSIWHWLIVLVVVLLLFGRGKIPDIMGDVAQGIKAFKKGMADDDKSAGGTSEPAKPVDHVAASGPAAPTAEAERPAESAHL